MRMKNLCRGSGAGMGGCQGGMSRGKTSACPVCGRRIGMRSGRRGTLYDHAYKSAGTKITINVESIFGRTPQ
jgi:hypothetical protein